MTLVDSSSALVTRPLIAAVPGHAPMPILAGRLCSAVPGGPSVPVNMIVDTGADGVYIRPGLAGPLGLAKHENPWDVKTPAALQTATAYVGAIEFNTDQGTVERLPCFAVELPSYAAGHDLLLGMGQLRHFVLTVDGPRNRFTLSRA